MPTRKPGLILALAAMACAEAPRPTPDVAFTELLEADRAFSAASAKTDLIRGLTAMFAANVAMPVPGGRFASGVEEARAALRAGPDSVGSTIEWSPIGGGLSSDGQHGFTFGYMTLKRGDSTVPLKYLSYWVKGADGWRVAAYRRGARAAGPGDPVSLPPVLPERIGPVITDTGIVAEFGRSVARIERDFSDEAQRIGLKAAFAKYGRPDAVNMGGPARPGFVVGAPAISEAVSQGEPDSGSSVSWGPDRVLVATSGDLGVTIGMIRPNTPSKGGPAGFPFFTIWRRGSPGEPWRYIAE